MRGKPSWSVVNALVAIAILVELIVLIGHPLFGWGPEPKRYMTTPPPLAGSPTARQVLLMLSRAAAVRAATGAGAGTGEYAYVEREWWQLPAGGSGSGTGPVLTQSWLAPDGSGRIVSTTRTAAGRTASDATNGGIGHPLPPLSAGGDAVAALLDAGAPGGGAAEPGPWEFGAFTTLADTEPIPPAVGAAILRRLAGVAGALYRGAVVDRAGRVGLSVSVDSAYSGPLVRYTLVLDPASGALLESDQTLVGQPGGLAVHDGAVLAYTTFLAAGYVGAPPVTDPQ